ncbi:MAG: ferredoxin [Planctomycetota bacterium]|jgi:ferredoxin
MQSQPNTTAPTDDAPGETPAPPQEHPLTNDGPEELLAGWAGGLAAGRATGEKPGALPVLPPEPPPMDVEEAAALGRLVRQFHAGDAGAAERLETPGDGLLPALLEPFRDPRRVRHDYPLFLHPTDCDGRTSAPLSDLLKQVTESFAPGDDAARILKDNFSRLERNVREGLDSTSPPVDAAGCLAEAGRALEAALDLGGDAARTLHDDLEKLVQAVPQGGRFLALGEHAPLHLFMHVVRRATAARRAALRQTFADLGNRLRDLLRTDLAKQAGGDQPDALAGAIGPAGQTYLDPAALARVLGPSRGSPPMDETRRERITSAIKTLDRFLPETAPLAVVVHSDDVPDACRPTDAEWRLAGEAGVCRAACDLFDEIAATHAPLYAAIRIAKLELAGAYDPSRHDALQEHFNWRAFSPNELLDLPPILALASAEHLAGTGMLDLSRLLLSGRLVNVVVTVQPAANPGLAAQDDPLAGFRFELGYLGVSHREAVVSQTSAARPDHLVKGFAQGLAATRAALHVVTSGLSADGRTPALGAWLHGGAALEGRAHPFFHYNPEAGQTWARRLDFTTNPQPEADWPVYTLPCRTPDGDESSLTIAFTFADFALLESAYRDHLRLLPPGTPLEGLATLDEYLALPPDDAARCVPCIWAADAENRLHRLVISHRLAFTCRDRLAYWRTLQELSGVRNEHVREAVERETQRLQSEFAAQRARLEDAHAAALAEARAEAAGVAMRHLAEALLAGDASALAPSPAAPAPTAPAAAAAPVEASEPAEAVVEEEEVEVEEPWIDTALCTTCNDCMDINAQVFIYNANKQAIIGDPTAGTFEQLVKAAEKCPARCIHPGKPLNPDEPNLEQLIERARPFNV